MASNDEVIAEAAAFLAAHQIPHDAANGVITVASTADDGFDIRLETGSPEHTLCAHCWHEHFHDSAEVLAAFKWLFEGEVRVRSSARGDYEYAWALEYLESGEWIAFSTTGLVFVPFWKKKNDRFYTNEYRITKRVDSQVT